MAKITVSPKTYNITDANVNIVKIYFTSDVTLADVKLSIDDGQNFLNNVGMTQTSADFNVANLENKNYTCLLKGFYEETVASSYSITNNLTHCTTSNTAETVNANSKYSTTINVETGFVLNSITVTMGGMDITNNVVNNNVITINYVTGDIVITAKAILITPSTCIITNNLTYCNTSNSTTSVTKGGSFSTIITAKSGYKINSISVTMGGTDITSTALNGNSISISNVTGNIVITAKAILITPSTYTITNNLTNCNNSNSDEIVSANSMYSATITADEGYVLNTITVTMGGTDITNAVVNSNTITINSVTSNVVITAKAIEEVTSETLTINNIGNITQLEKTEFYISYSTNKAVTKHEVSWDGGSTFYDKTSDVTANGTNYKFKHDNSGSVGTYEMAIRVTTSSGETKTSNVFTVTLTEVITYEMSLKTDDLSTFNDTNYDGLGEFQGWGTSLCWWANRLGYNKNLISQAVDKFYSENGLNLNIGRYNVGGGDCVRDSFHTPYYIDSTNKKQVYDLTTSGLKPEYHGSKMKVKSINDFANVTYQTTDEDFDITKGNKIGEFKAITYVSQLDNETEIASVLKFNNINVTNSGRYKIKLLFVLSSTNTRDVSIKVNKTLRYTVSANTINNNIIATSNDLKIYLVTIDGVYLPQGINTIEVGGNSSYCLDFIKMAIIRHHNDNQYKSWSNSIINKNSYIYDLLGYHYPTHSGTNQENQIINMDTTYKTDDLVFGIESGNKVEELQSLGYIPKLDTTDARGSNLTYNVYIEEANNYTIQFLLYLTGANDRDVAIKVNGTTYTIESSVINENIVAEDSVGKLYIARFYEINLVKGNNTIIIGGSTGWCLDLVKMMIMKTSAYLSLPSNNDLIHDSHIKRSDSAIPGYCTDVTKIDTNAHNIDWYNKYYERVDEECGYAWNYDWDADEHQMNMTKAIAKAKGSEFIAEAFSNSPPYFMTNSSCSSGATDSSQNNLKENSYNAFAKYMADVIAHINKDNSYGFEFTSATGMNEPYTNYWGANSNKQEGCHIDQGTAQSRVIKALNWNIKDKGVNNCIVSGTDETSIDIAIDSYNALDNDAKETISRIDTHTYSGTKRYELRELAEKENKNLWMSEVDGDFTAGDNAGHMASALGLAKHILLDLNWLKPSAWILWDIVDMHCDTGNSHDGNDFGWLNQDGGYWGLTGCNHDDEYIWLLKKYYAFGQFTRYIQPGHTIIPMSDDNAVASYDSQNHKLVIVVMNTWATDRKCKFTLTNINTDGVSNIQAIRTSGGLTDGENWADVTSSCEINIDKQNKTFSSLLKANSITTYIINDVSYKTKITIKNIDDMSVTKGEQFDVVYRTNVAAIKHEVSWDGGNTFYDKTSEITSNGTTYTYKHDADIENNTLFITIKVTDANNNSATTSFTVTQTIVTDPYREGRTLLWEDDFIGSSLSKNWDYENNYHRPNEVQNYVAGTNNVWVENSNLVIKAKRENSNGQSWTSGCIHTNDKQEFMYGRIEAKIKIPQTYGSFPAFWTLGGNYDEGYGINWPYCGEIDIMEHKFGAANITAGALYHTELLWDRWDVVSNLGRVDSGNIGSYDDYHIYSLEWTYNKIDYYVDDVLIGHSDISDDSKYFMFHQPHYMLLNLAIGAAGGVPPTDVNEYTMYVDWVRVYAPEQAPTHGDTSNWIWFEDTSARHMDKWSKIGLVPKFNESWTNKVIWWDSSDTNIATVRGGRVDSKGVDGSCVITATTLEGQSASITINVGNV